MANSGILLSLTVVSACLFYGSVSAAPEKKTVVDYGYDVVWKAWGEFEGQYNYPSDCRALLHLHPDETLDGNQSELNDKLAITAMCRWYLLTEQFGVGDEHNEVVNRLQERMSDLPLTYFPKELAHLVIVSKEQDDFYSKCGDKEDFSILHLGETHKIEGCDLFGFDYDSCRFIGGRFVFNKDARIDADARYVCDHDGLAAIKIRKMAGLDLNDGGHIALGVWFSYSTGGSMAVNSIYILSPDDLVGKWEYAELPELTLE